MLSISVEDALALALLWLVCGAISMYLFMRPAVMRYAGRAVMAAIQNPDEDVRAAVLSLVSMILGANIATGCRLKNENWKEIDETLPFLRYVGRELWHYLGMMRKASTGGKSTMAGEDLDPLGLIRPRRGQSTADFMLEQMSIRMGPKLDEIITKKMEQLLNNGKDQIL